jgi:membrane fusion protein, multidrug efflux system
MSIRYPFPNSPLAVGLWLIACVLHGCVAEASDKDLVPASAPPSAEANGADEGAKQAISPLRPNELTGRALELAGDLKPEHSADLSFKTSGLLQTLKVSRGERVKKGQLLATLSDAEARAQLAQTEAAIAQAEAQLALARDNEARASSLVAANAAPGSQATMVRLQTASAQAALLQANAARDLAAAALANHLLKAPFDGELVKVPDGLGQIVTPGTLLFRLEALDRLVLRATISEADVDKVKVGDDVTIEASGGRKVTGKVRLVLRSLEAQSRRVPIEVTVPNKERPLIAGSYVRATHRSR